MSENTGSAFIFHGSGLVSLFFLLLRNYRMILELLFDLGMSEDQFLIFGEIWRKYGRRDEAGADLAFELRNFVSFIIRAIMI